LCANSVRFARYSIASYHFGAIAFSNKTPKVWRCIKTVRVLLTFCS
jgi:hypothetical protein